MKEFLLFEHPRTRFGLWRQQLAGFTEIPHITRLSQGAIHVAALIEGEIRYLLDLLTCINVQERDDGGQHYALLLEGEEGVAGFWLLGDITTHQIDNDAIYPFPSHLRGRLIKSAVIVEGRLIPVLEAPAVLQACSGGGALELTIKKKRNAIVPEPSGHYLTYMASGYRFAGDTGSFERVAGSDHAVTALPFAPDMLAGITLIEERIVPVIDLQRAMRLEPGGSQTDLLLTKGGGEFALSVGSGSADEKAGTPDRLPELFRVPWMMEALRLSSGILPVLDMAALVYRRKSGDDGGAFRYRLESDFSKKLFSESVSIVEISIGGVRYGIPADDIERTMDVPDFSDVPGRTPLARGVLAVGEALLPVIDLAGYFGIDAATDQKALILENGTFKACVLVDTVSEERELSVEVQRSLPVTLPHPVIYGCYLHENDITLILDVASLVIHSGDVETRKALSVYTEPARQAAEAALADAPAIETPDPEPVDDVRPAADVPPVEIIPPEDEVLTVVDLGYSDIADDSEPDNLEPNDPEPAHAEPPEVSPSEVAQEDTHGFASRDEEDQEPASVPVSQAASPPVQSRKRSRRVLLAILLPFVLIGGLVIPAFYSPGWLRGTLGKTPVQTVVPTAVHGDDAIAEGAPAAVRATVPAAAPSAAPATAPAVESSVSVRSVSGDIHSPVVKTIYFTADSSALPPASGRVFEEIVKLVRVSGDMSVSVTGHAADYGTEESCLILSVQRAVNVRNALLSIPGIDENRLVFRGVGIAEPMTDELDSQEAYLNRRVEIELTFTDG